MDRRGFLIGIGAVGFVGAAAWVGLRPDEAASRHYSLRLAWLPGATFVGDYVASVQKLWSVNDIDIAIGPGGFEFDAIKLVVSGADTFGVTSGPQFIQARAEGLPIVAIGATIPRSPIGWVSHIDSGIRGPRDFIGKKIGAQYGTHTEITFEALMAKVGIPLSEVERVPVRFDLTPFVTHQIDVLPVYLIDQPIDLDAMGILTNKIDPKAYGVSMSYGNLYFTTEKFARENRDVVKKFVEGAKQGWLQAYRKRTEATLDVVSAAPSLNQMVVRKKIDAIFSFIDEDKENEYTGIFPVEVNKLQSTADIIKRYGDLKGDPLGYLRDSTISF